MWTTLVIAQRADKQALYFFLAVFLIRAPFHENVCEITKPPPCGLVESRAHTRTQPCGLHFRMQYEYCMRGWTSAQAG